MMVGAAEGGYSNEVRQDSYQAGREQPDPFIENGPADEIYDYGGGCAGDSRQVGRYQVYGMFARVTAAEYPGKTGNDPVEQGRPENNIAVRVPVEGIEGNTLRKMIQDIVDQPQVVVGVNAVEFDPVSAENIIER